MTGSRVGGFEILYPVNEVAAHNQWPVAEVVSSPRDQRR
jgi:hypothetical protein